MIQKLKCLLGLHEGHTYDEWIELFGKQINKLADLGSWSVTRYAYEVDRTMDLVIRRCRHCGRER